jgi:RNA polymerase sigma-70 factor (ECF subfamily)
MDRDDLIPTRATLIERLKSWQDQSSWQEFFDSYWRLIYNVARKGGLTEAESQDVVQETMISVARHMPGFKYDPSVGSFKTWLLNLTRWRIADQIRSRAVAGQPAAAKYPSAPEPVPEEIIDPASERLDAYWNDQWEKNLFDAERVARTYKISVDQVYLIKHRVAQMIKDEVKRLEANMT